MPTYSLNALRHHSPVGKNYERIEIALPDTYAGSCYRLECRYERLPGIFVSRRSTETGTVSKDSTVRELHNVIIVG